MFFLFQSNPLLIAAAVIPAIWLLIRVYRLDSIEPEPVGLLVKLVIMGVVAALLSLVSEKAGIWILDRIFNTENRLYHILTYFGVVACSEEGFKYLLMKRSTWTVGAFNYQFDGVVYAIFVSLGFALWENINYVLMYGLATALVRAVTAIPGHACFGVFMGAWYGMAKLYANRGDESRSRLCRKLSFVVPVLLHGAYDYIAVRGSMGNSLIFFGFILVLFIFAFRKVKQLARQDQHI